MPVCIPPTYWSKLSSSAFISPSTGDRSVITTDLPSVRRPPDWQQTINSSWEWFAMNDFKLAPAIGFDTLIHITLKNSMLQ